ncbi:MAG: type II toxin-antitoxin system VapC family toxin [Bdellovibrionota bacterium]
MNVVDSSAWLEYFTNRPNAPFFATPIENTAELIVPAICIFEVFKRVLKERGEKDALQAVMLMEKGEVIALDAMLALTAARLSVQVRLPMADSIILATAHTHHAILWAQDADFKDFEGVEYRERKQ